MPGAELAAETADEVCAEFFKLDGKLEQLDCARIDMPLRLLLAWVLCAAFSLGLEAVPEEDGALLAESP